MARPTSRVSRVLMTGPLAPFSDAYELELAARGYTRRTTVNQLRQVARLSRWLEEWELTAAELSSERVEEFLAFQHSRGRFRSQWSRPGLLCLLDVLRGLEVVGVEEAPPTEPLLGSFEHYLVAERGLAAGTVRGYVRHAGRFLVGLSPSGDLAEVTAGEVTEAVLRESALCQ